MQNITFKFYEQDKFQRRTKSKYNVGYAVKYRTVPGLHAELSRRKTVEHISKTAKKYSI